MSSLQYINVHGEMNRECCTADWNSSSHTAYCRHYTVEPVLQERDCRCAITRVSTLPPLSHEGTKKSGGLVARTGLSVRRLGMMVAGSGEKRTCRPGVLGGLPCCCGCAGSVPGSSATALSRCVETVRPTWMRNVRKDRCRTREGPS